MIQGGTRLLPGLVLLALVWPAAVVQAQEPPPGPPPGDQVGPGMHRRGRGPRDARMRELLLRLAEMPPEQQRQTLENDPGFQQMPPHVQERIRQQLDRLNQLSPEERAKTLEHLRHGRRPRRGQELFLRVAPLSPEEQERALAEDEFFQSLPPHARQRFRGHLERFSSRTPEARERELRRLRHFSKLPGHRQDKLRRRAHRFAGMSPEQRQQARQVFGAWRQLPPERRTLMTERLRRLHHASPEERGALINDEEFLAPLAQQERILLRQVWELRRDLPPPPPPPADRP